MNPVLAVLCAIACLWCVKQAIKEMWKSEGYELALPVYGITAVICGVAAIGLYVM